MISLFIGDDITTEEGVNPSEEEQEELEKRRKKMEQEEKGDDEGSGEADRISRRSYVAASFCAVTV